AGEERDHHDAEAQLQRSKITGALRKPASPPCGKRANQSAQRSQDEIGLIAKAKLLLHEKVKVVEVVGRRERVQSLEDQNPGFKSGVTHPASLRLPFG